MIRIRLSNFIPLLLIFIYACGPSIPPAKQEFVRLDPLRAAIIADSLNKAVNPQLAPGLEVKLWASDSLVADPIALSIDEQGRIYTTRTNRQKDSEFDIRGHRDWMTASISLQSVEDRRAFLRAEFAPERSDSNQWFPDLNQDAKHDWRDLAVQREEVHRIWDESGDGVADVSQLYTRDFQTEVTDVAGGLLVHEKDVYVAVAPDLWKLEDRNNDGVADKKESLSHGYQAHIGFGAHGMSGVTIGPDGRIYWGIGDIGLNVVDKTGKRWEYPNQGAILRCNPDGSDFEVFAAGLRNTHEFVFDDYGNIISEDNDGDHPGEMERLVYITHGSDAGWRTNWQFGKYTDPDNNLYKVWMDEELFKPRQASTPAYIVPPIKNYHGGPTGMIYNPGTAISQKYRNHFFIVSFRGTASRSPLYAFQLKPEGAGFAFDGEELIMQGGVLPTGIEVGPDGALYIGDWIDGWGTKNYGRIWRLDDPVAAKSAIRKETEALIRADFADKPEAELQTLLGHLDKRIRQKAQFALAKRGAGSVDFFVAAAQNASKPYAQVHALWGLWQLSIKDRKHAVQLMPFLKNENEEIRAQAAKILGDVRYTVAAHSIVPLLKDKSARVRFFAAEALGRMSYGPAFDEIISMLEQNNEEDVYLRHAGVLALSRMGKPDPLVALAKSDNRALRIAAVVALRRMKDPRIADFLQDQDEYIVLETARAIHDDFSIEGALPYLAAMIKTTQSRNEALIRRIINANLRLGKPENARWLATYVKDESAPIEMRAEAMAVLGVWGKPSVLDRVDGRYRGPVERSQDELTQVKSTAAPLFTDLLDHPEPLLQQATIEAVGRLGDQASADKLLAIIQQDSNVENRLAALNAMKRMAAPNIDQSISAALVDPSKRVRSLALGLLPKLGFAPEKTVAFLQSSLQEGSLEEKQAAIATLSDLPASATREVFLDLFGRLKAGRLASSLELELGEAMKASGDADLAEALADYEAERAEMAPLIQYAAALNGGKARAGREIFINNSSAQCMRCHAVGDYGASEVGPNLAGIANELSREQLLEALVDPSARLAPGYGTVLLTLKNGEKLSGILRSESALEIEIQGSTAEPIHIPKARIAQRRNTPSAMPPMGETLEMREIRDLVAFLATLK
ncbi:MAG: HEAT repeat domain-containing protein [Bacteroidota bacterium]